jgi:hypothetical protein
VSIAAISIPSPTGQKSETSQHSSDNPKLSRKILHF